MTSGELCALMLVVIFFMLDSINDKLRDIRSIMRKEPE